MFGRKPRWLRSGEAIINLERVDSMEQDKSDVKVYFHRDEQPVWLKNVMLGDIHYFLKHGKPRKRKA